MKINKLILQTFYLETLREFYSSILELSVSSGDPKNIHIHIGNSELIFMETKNAEPFYHFAINIPSNKIEEAKNWLSNRVKLLWMEDYENDIADFVNWHAKSVYFYDPAGNILELIARFDLHNPSNQPFSSKQFFSIDEAGVVFKQNDFDQKISELLTDYSLDYFSKQPPLPQFRVIGDDQGLFIAVPEHRNWYPTDKSSGIFPVIVEFENKKQIHRLELN